MFIVIPVCSTLIVIADTLHDLFMIHFAFEINLYSDLHNTNTFFYKITLLLKINNNVIILIVHSICRGSKKVINDLCAFNTD